MVGMSDNINRIKTNKVVTNVGGGGMFNVGRTISPNVTHFNKAVKRSKGLNVVGV